MAIVSKDSIAANFSGVLGKDYILKRYGDRTVVTMRPGKRKKKPEHEKSMVRLHNEEVFRRAKMYYRELQRDKELFAAYTALLKPGKRVYDVAQQDYINSRKVKREPFNVYTLEPLLPLAEDIKAVLKERREVMLKG